MSWPTRLRGGCNSLQPLHTVLCFHTPPPSHTADRAAAERSLAMVVPARQLIANVVPTVPAVSWSVELMNPALAFSFLFSARPGAELVGVTLFAGANIDTAWRRPNATRVLAGNGTGIPEVYPFHAAAKALLRPLPQVGWISGTKEGCFQQLETHTFANLVRCGRRTSRRSGHGQGGSQLCRPLQACTPPSNI